MVGKLNGMVFFRQDPGLAKRCSSAELGMADVIRNEHSDLRGSWLVD